MPRSSLATEPETKRIPVPADPERLGSLDAFRGFVMLWIIGGEGLMVGLAALGHNRVIDAIVYELSHSPWQGLRFYDCIWPSFMLMVGVSVSSFVCQALPYSDLSSTIGSRRKARRRPFLAGFAARIGFAWFAVPDRIEQRLAAHRNCLFRGGSGSPQVLAFPGLAWRRDPRWLCAGLSIHSGSRHTGR